MKRKWFKKSLCFLFAALFVVLAIPFSSYAADVTVPEDIDTSSVTADLEKIGIDITKYPKDESATHARMLNFLEYGYDYYGTDADYGLYVYFYNPTGKPIKISRNNYIQMQVKADSGSVGSGFSKYPLDVCSYSTVQGYEHVFYKFKVLGAEGFKNTLSRDFRHYDISGIEVQYTDSYKATEYEVGGIYSFMGFMPYCGPERNAKNTLEQHVTDRTTVSIELHPLSWKTQTSDKGAYYQYEVSSVYFSVPNDIIEDYGNENAMTKGLVQVDGSYEEYKINGLVTPYETDIYDVIYPYLGEVSNLPFALYWEYTYFPIEHDRMWGYSINGLDFKGGEIYPYKPDSFIEKHDSLCTIFSYGSFSKFEGISSEELKQGLYSIMDDRNGNLPVLPEVDDGYTKGYQSYSIKAGEDMSKDIATYASNHNKFWSWLAGEGNLYLEDESYSDIHSIQAVSLKDIFVDGLWMKDAAIAEKYFMEESEVKDFKNFVYSSALKDESVFILRFAVRDYYCSDVFVAVNENYPEDSGNYYFEKTIFMNFDILTFTWEDEYSRQTVIPVVCSPIDIVGSITPTREPSITGAIKDKLEDAGDWLSKFWEILNKTKPIVAVILILIVLAILCWLLSKFGAVLNPLFKGIGKVISAPFKLFKRKSDAEKRKEEEHEWKGKEHERKGEEHIWKGEKHALQKEEHAWKGEKNQRDQKEDIRRDKRLILRYEENKRRAEEHDWKRNKEIKRGNAKTNENKSYGDVDEFFEAAAKRWENEE